MNGFEEPVSDNPRVAQLAALAQPLAGRFPPETGPQLHRFARDVAPDGDIVELSLTPGKSALWLAAGAHERGSTRLVVVDDAAAGSDGAFVSALDAAGVGVAVERRRAAPVAAAHAWERGISISLLHLDRGADHAPLRELFELWSRFIVPGGFVMFDGVPTYAGPTRLMHELPRWWRYYSAMNGKWIAVKANDPWPVRR